LKTEPSLNHTHTLTSQYKGPLNVTELVRNNPIRPAWHSDLLPGSTSLLSPSKGPVLAPKHLSLTWTEGRVRGLGGALIWGPAVKSCFVSRTVERLDGWNANKEEDYAAQSAITKSIIDRQSSINQRLNIKLAEHTMYINIAWRCVNTTGVRTARQYFNIDRYYKMWCISISIFLYLSRSRGENAQILTTLFRESLMSAQSRPYDWAFLNAHGVDDDD
jgi:hypothetical protein